MVLNGEKSDPYETGAKPSYLGVYIYAHARKLMYTKIFTKVRTHYTDTDSALILYEDYCKFRAENPELFAKETIQLDGKEYQIKPFGTLDCEMKTYDDAKFRAENWALLYNETEEEQRQIAEQYTLDGKTEWIGVTDAYLLAPKNYLVVNP